jgi:hypothetical protein
MKTLILLSIGFTMAFFEKTLSEPLEQICTGDVILSSQAEVDAFNCNEITGSLTISGSDITDLIGLVSLQQVHGDLRIGQTNMTTLDGPSLLDFVGGRLEISSTTLTTIKGFASLRKVGRLEIILRWFFIPY